MLALGELAPLAQKNNQGGGAGAAIGFLLFVAVILVAVVLLVRRYPNYRSSDESDGLIVLAAVLLALFTLGIMLPSSIAIVRKVRNVGSIIVINFFLWWSVIGWVVALAMAASSKPQAQQTNVYVQHQTTVTAQPTQPPPQPTETPAIPPPPPVHPV